MLSHARTYPLKPTRSPTCSPTLTLCTQLESARAELEGLDILEKENQRYRDALKDTENKLKRARQDLQKERERTAKLCQEVLRSCLSIRMIALF